MKRLILPLLLTLYILPPQTSADQRPQNFREAKKEMVNIFYKLNEPTTLYCGCPIKFTKNHGYRPDIENCEYKTVFDKERGSRIEAEHIVPVWEFAHNMRCWKKVPKGEGRSNCENNDNYFNLIESDLHNLYPSIGEVNKDRSSYKFVSKLDSPDNPNGYGQCKMYFNSEKRIVQPTKRSRGIVARAYLYMHKIYNIPLDKEQLHLFRSWNQSYKVTDNECKRNYLINKIQGNDNPFVTEQCKLRIKHPTVNKKDTQ